MKKIFFTILLCFFLPLFSSAKIFTVEISEGVSMSFNVISVVEKTVEVYGTKSAPSISRNVEGVITIPSEVSNSNVVYNVIGIKSDSFYRCSKLTLINIPEGVTYMGSYAFADCSALTSINIPENVVEIGSYAFAGCSALTSISIPGNVVEIGSNTFANCSALTSISIPESVTKIDGSAFYNCSALTSISIPEKVVEIGNSVFNGCRSLSRILIGSNIKSIGNYAFDNCSALKDLVIEESEYDLNIGVSNVNGVMKGLFSSTPIESLFIGRNISSQYSPFIVNKSITNVEIAGNVESIPNEYFKGCTGIKNVILPDILKSIGDGAFSGCNNLTSINVTDNILSIGGSAFYNCSMLESFHVPSNLTTIEGLTFYNCASLNSVEIPGKVQSIGGAAFSGCSGLTSLSILDGVRLIGQNAFSDCIGLTELTLPNTVSSINNSAFSGCTQLKTINTGDGIEYIGNDAFNGCQNLESAILGTSLHKIGSNAFFKCTLLSNLSMSKNVRAIGEKAFCGCSSLSSISFQGEGDAPVDPNTDYEIGDNSFQGCSLLPYFYVANGVTSIGNSAFSGCQSLTSITIPVSVTSIEESAFSNCTNLTSVNIPEDVTSIGKNAFFGCSSLTTITIPKNIRNIEAQAFYGCNSLARIYSKIQEPFVLPNAVFKKSNSEMEKATLFVPYQKRNIYNSTSGWSNDVYIKESVPETGNCFTSLISSDAEPVETLFLVTSESPLKVQIGDGEKMAFPTGFASDNIDIPSTFVNEDDYHFTITGIGENAFKDCTTLTILTIPNSVVNIENAFSGCTNLNSVTVNWRKPLEVRIDTDCFNDIANDVVLYVPAGTKERYAESEIWGRFSQIVESGPISTGDISARYGSKADLPIYLKNNEEIEGLQFKLTLPEGVTVAENDGGLITSTTDRTDGMIIMGSKDPDAENSYLFVLLSLDGNAIAGNEGAIMNVKLNIAPDVALGDYEIKIEDVFMTTASYDTLHPTESTSDLTVTDIMLGDVNNDGIINVTDAIGVVNYILKNTPSSFVEGAADVNEDGIINVTDAIGVVNMILRNGTSRRMIKDYTTEPQ